MTAYDTLVLAKNPIGYWKLDEASGLTLVDSSPNANTMTIQAATEPERYHVAGVNPTSIPYGIDWNNQNRARLASGVPGQFGVGSSFTVESWVGAVGLPSSAYGLLTKGYDSVEQRPWYSLGFDTDGRPFFWFRNAAATDFKCKASQIITDANYSAKGPWHYLVGAYDAFAQVAKLYVDGLLLQQLSVPNTGWGTGVQPLAINQLATTSGGPWQASAAIYSGGFSDAAIANAFTVGLATTAYYPGQVQTVTAAVQAELDAIKLELDQILASVRKTYPTT